MNEARDNQNPYSTPSGEDGSAQLETNGRIGLVITAIAAVVGWIWDVLEGLNAYELYNHSRRIIPWGGRLEEVLGLMILGSVLFLLIGLVKCVCNLPNRFSIPGVVLAVLCLVIHAATIYYARHVIINFG